MTGLWLVGVALANPYEGAPAPPVEGSPFTWRVPERAVDVIELVLTVPEHHAVYRDQIEIRATRGAIGQPVFPEAVLAPDLYEPGAWRASYSTDVRIRVPVERTEAGEVELSLQQQGCRSGLCWPIVVTAHTVKVLLTATEGNEP